MLSVNFNRPLAGRARNERVKQLSNSHPAFETSSEMQAVLVKIQTTLRRMPGISAQESSDIIEELQEIGRTINQETSQLVDAVVNMTLDQEETDKALARMSIRDNVISARTEEKDETIRNLKTELAVERDKRASDQERIKALMQDCEALTSDYQELQTAKTSSPHHEPASAEKAANITALQDKIKHLQEQVNDRRSIWAMRNKADPQELAPATSTLTESSQVHGNPKVGHAIAGSLKSLHDKEEVQQNGHFEPEAATCVSSERPQRPPTSLQVWNRPPTATAQRPSAFQNAGSRAASTTATTDRRIGTWNPSIRTTPAASVHCPTSSFHSGPPRSAWSRSARALGHWGPEHQGPEYGRPASSFMPRLPSSYDPGRDGFQRTPTRSGRGRFSGNLANVASPHAVYEHAGHNYGSHRLPPPPPPPPQQQQQYGGPLSSFARMSDPGFVNWNERIMDFYAVIREFVETHANKPNAALTPGKLMATSTWDILTATYHPLSEQEAASYLAHHLRQENSKCCLVTRVIIDYVVHRVWCLIGWMNIDHESTITFAELDREFERAAGQPSTARQPLLDRQATIIDSILKRENQVQIHKQKVSEIAGTLLNFLEPLLNKLTSNSDAYRSLEEVASSAWKLSSDILTSRLTFDFRFPEIGSRFSSQSMLAIWPTSDPLELQARHWRIALVVTPVITCRNDMGTNISAHSVALADVICMQ